MFTNMQSHTIKTNSIYKDLILAILLGLLIGLTSVGLIKSLNFIHELHIKISNNFQYQWFLVLIPIVSVFLNLLKKNTLYFPTQIKKIHDDLPIQKGDWNPLMSVYTYIGVCLSHLSGASLGREGANVLLNSGWVRLLRLDFQKWIPIASAVGFSSIIGVPWVSLIFLIEMFTTSTNQKIFVLVAAFVASNVTLTFHTPHLLNFIEINKSIGFFEGIIFCICLGIASGSLVKLYKMGNMYISNLDSRKQLYFQFLIACSLVFLFNIKIFNSYQGLGLDPIVNIMSEKLEYHDVIFKLLLTFLSIQVGLWGGEFVPFVFCGLVLGKNLASSLNFDLVLGTYLGSYLFFAAATRLKWTSIFLMISLLGWQWLGWIYFLVTVTLSFSGNSSLYKNENSPI